MFSALTGSPTERDPSGMCTFWITTAIACSDDPGRGLLEHLGRDRPLAANCRSPQGAVLTAQR
jgi:hypothetical protein